MGMALANQRAIDVSLMLEFQQTLVQLLVGALFVLIAASVSPAEVDAVMPEALALVAVLALDDAAARAGVRGVDGAARVRGRGLRVRLRAPARAAGLAGRASVPPPAPLPMMITS